MNYIKQINGFWNWVLLNGISQGEMVLYMAVLHCANVSNWKSSLTIPNSTLLSLTKISDRAQLNKVRNRLIQTGLIRYEKGSRGKTGTYVIKKLYGENDTGIGVNMCSENNTGSDTQPDTYPDTYPGTNRTPIRPPYINKTKTKQNETKSPLPPYEEIIKSYNDICRDLPKVASVSDKRRSAIAARLKKYTPEQIAEVFRKAQESDFLSGRNDKGWKCSFDWLMNENNMIKVLEGNYDNRIGTGEKSFGVYRDNVDHNELEKLMREKYDGGVS